MGGPLSQQDIKSMPSDEIYIQHLRERFGLKFIDLEKKKKKQNLIKQRSPSPIQEGNLVINEKNKTRSALAKKEEPTRSHGVSADLTAHSYNNADLGLLSPKIELRTNITADPTALRPKQSQRNITP